MFGRYGGICGPEFWNSGHVHGTQVIHDRGLRHLGEFVGGGQTAKRIDDQPDDLLTEHIQLQRTELQHIRHLYSDPHERSGLRQRHHAEPDGEPTKHIDDQPDDLLTEQLQLQRTELQHIRHLHSDAHECNGL